MIYIRTYPPSVNKLYMTRGRYRVLTPEAREWKENAKQYILTQIDESYPATLLDKHLTVEIKLFRNDWICKNGNIRKVDAASYEKCLIDTLFDALKDYEPTLDDSAIFQITISKGVSPLANEYIQIELLPRS